MPSFRNLVGPAQHQIEFACRSPETAASSAIVLSGCLSSASTPVPAQRSVSGGFGNSGKGKRRPRSGPAACRRNRRWRVPAASVRRHAPRQGAVARHQRRRVRRAFQRLAQQQRDYRGSSAGSAASSSVHSVGTCLRVWLASPSASARQASVVGAGRSTSRRIRSRSASRPPSSRRLLRASRPIRSNTASRELRMPGSSRCHFLRPARGPVPGSTTAPFGRRRDDAEQFPPSPECCRSNPRPPRDDPAGCSPAAWPARVAPRCCARPD